MDKKSDFILAAIVDIQATIRAVDVKIAALLVGLLAPVANLDKVFHVFDKVHSKDPKIMLAAMLIFLLLWLLAASSLAMAIGAISNPAPRINGHEAMKGAFYAGYLFEFGILDVFLNRGLVRANKDIDKFDEDIPINSVEIERELVFEQMKVAYIRDIKLQRFKWGFRLSCTWVLISTLICVYSKYGA